MGSKTVRRSDRQAEEEPQEETSEIEKEERKLGLVGWFFGGCK